MATFTQQYMKFLTDHNIIGLAMGLIIGNNLLTLANAFIDGILMPTLDPIIGQFTTDANKEVNLFGIRIKLGEFLNHLIKFLILTIVIVYGLNYLGIAVSKPVSWVRVVNVDEFRGGI